MKVKICGIRNLDAALAAERGGADFIGFIFYARSRRWIHPEQAAQISQKIFHAKKVGVFVDEFAGEVNRIARKVGLDYVQLHGHETAEYAAHIEIPVIKAWRYGDGFRAEAANAFPSELVLVDSFVKGKAGGTGKTFSWEDAAGELKKLRKSWLLAGGISFQNVKEAADLFQPYGVDVSGSLEVNGEKSVKKIQDFLTIVKRLNREGLR